MRGLFASADGPHVPILVQGDPINLLGSLPPPRDQRKRDPS